MLAVRGELALARLDHRDAAIGQQPEVGLGGRMLVHAAVHRRRDHDRAVRRQRRRGEQVVGMAVRELGQGVSARRRDQVHVRPLDQRQMADRRPVGDGLARVGAARGIGLELAAQHRRAGDRLK